MVVGEGGSLQNGAFWKMKKDPQHQGLGPTVSCIFLESMHLLNHKSASIFTITTLSVFPYQRRILLMGGDQDCIYQIHSYPTGGKQKSSINKHKGLILQQLPGRQRDVTLASSKCGLSQHRRESTHRDCQ